MPVAAGASCAERRALATLAGTSCPVIISRTTRTTASGAGCCILAGQKIGGAEPVLPLLAQRRISSRATTSTLPFERRSSIIDHQPAPSTIASQ